ncbi:hypothetical protein COCC4DRAFT_29576 [Bipolaris maydis ATCC 48331]|uniref:Malate dehydrogenase n=2 Tax=Cochliobolus heterostrophus TaxID=5016 RepID=M2V8Z7_COCH5|nr:uncharacterized protein COCC4DRAFT_29576 [Bipolaris maydis ATCC 48331]EMD96203.1 hypothetical protein COCHEDRAFT_1019589 [Bipolaris maydis C5]KAH7562043.1 hypothetical protein BM1_03147 [Bipolaris maydis]ENI11062.1 hypothetical protein COCC4DRAFT_29576 [Bipolaris maydis ATCC 48331]KAJ5030870.1 hypothetical protein J3E73DRAFT_280559 [Bipolaris maydis]KAJ5065897.1 hypothetical protein J3E74DRAFT_305779 [Bipolaris maydis]
MRTSLFLTVVALTGFTAATPLRRLPMPATGGFVTPRVPTAQGDVASACNKATLKLPASGLAAPSGNPVLVALGVGFQNYTCADASSAPTSIGAVAQLFDDTCNVAAHPAIATSDLPAFARIGSHFFRDTTTPDFDVASLGNTILKKAQEVDAPNPASDVKWLRLTAQAGSTSTVKEIYRVQTVGGIAPATCAGKAAGEVITVPYKAQYWFYE